MQNENFKNIDQYIKNFPKDVRDMLSNIRQTISATAPQAEETIKYKMPTFVLNGKNLAHFAGYKNHIGFYPTPVPIKLLEKDLKNYEVSKGTIKFSLDKPIPITLIKKIVRLRAKAINSK